MQNCNHWEKENKWGEYYHSPGCLEIISRLWYRKGDPQGQHGDFAELRRQRLEFSKAEVAKQFVGRVPKKRKLHKERITEICIEVSLSLWLSDIPHMKRVKLYEAGQKQFPECGRQTLKVAPTVWCSCLCVTSSLWAWVEPVTYF